MKYIRSLSDKKFYISLIFLNLLCVATLWTVSYLDFINMVNNGYVNKNSIVFKTNESVKLPTEYKDDYILFQYSGETPNVKYVWFNGEVTLPPIQSDKKDNVYNEKENFVIAGENVDIKDIPTEFNLYKFNTPNSYKLNSEIWLISNATNIDVKNGSNFVITSPKNNEIEVLKNIFDEDSVQIIDHEKSGTYNLISNKLLMVGIKLCLFFAVINFLIIGIVWLFKEKYLVRILYLSGQPTYIIFFKILRYKTLPYTLLSICLYLMVIFGSKLLPSLWTNNWILHSLYIMIGYVFYLVIVSFFVTKSYSKGQGGRKY